MATIQSLFPSDLSTKEYRVDLYSNASSGGWDVDVHTLIVNEAQGYCQIEYDESRVNNSHGTDWDDKVYRSDRYTLEEMANYLERNFSPAAINAKPPKEQEFYNRDVYRHARRLREAAKAYTSASAIVKHLKPLLSPQDEIVSNSFSSSSAIFFIKDKSQSTEYALKLTAIPKACKRAIASTMETLQKMRGTHLMPIESIQWKPLDADHEILILKMPKMRGVPIVTASNGEIHYEQMDDFNGKGPLLQVAIDVAAGLAELHRCGLVHHDVKPENLFSLRKRSAGAWETLVLPSRFPSSIRWPPPRPSPMPPRKF